MPWAAPKPCSWPGCPKLAHGTYCKEHSKQESQDYERTRAGSSKRGYGATWQKLRGMHLRSYPLCRLCQLRGTITPATEVDHIVPLARGGGNRVSNLQSLCKTCHSAKTAREDNRWGKHHVRQETRAT